MNGSKPHAKVLKTEFSKSCHRLELINGYKNTVELEKLLTNTKWHSL